MKKSHSFCLQRISKIDWSFKLITTVTLAYTISLTPLNAQQIVIDGKTNTSLRTNGNITNVTTSTIKGSNAFNSFSKFNVNSGKTVNLVVPSSSNNLINLVHDESTNINGVLNSIQNGKVGGNIFLVNPYGVTVGSQGVINVGSLTTVTPTKDFTDNFFTAPNVVNDSSVEALLSGSAPINPDALINIEGKINAVGNVKLDSGKLYNSGEIRSGALLTVNDIESGDIVNLDSIEEGASITNNAGTITINANSISLDKTSIIAAKGIGSTGGEINISGSFVSVGGEINSSGTSGGTININADLLSLAGDVTSLGSEGAGGSVNFKVSGNTLETTSSFIDVSGSTGGSISHIASQQITTSGNYNAIGNSGIGGSIYISGSATKLLSTQINASGKLGGGEILLGGEYQGGKNLETNVIPNAETLVMTSGTNIIANTTGTSGDGGKIITWADSQTIVLGNLEAMPGTISGNGGFIEVSSGDSATFNATVQTGYGDRLGNFLLDPKNITIADQDYSEYMLIIGYNYVQGSINQSLGSTYYFGSSVSLDGTNLAIGAYGDKGYNPGVNSYGAIYLYSFDDVNLSGGKLEGIIGNGYTGDKNINQSLDNNDAFGFSVSLDGSGLVVGAPNDWGYNNDKQGSGAVYMYTFSDTEFNNGTLQGIIGEDYTENKSYNQSLDDKDYFGYSVSLKGTNLAIGAYYDDGVDDTGINTGAVYLFSFTDESFSGASLEGIIGKGYTADKSYNQNLDNNSYFGSAVSLNNNNIAIGAYGDKGYLNNIDNAGAVYLYNFSDAYFSNASLKGIIGSDYTGTNDVYQPLEMNDNFGAAISLLDDRLAVGAYGDDGYNDNLQDSGAVYLYRFTDNELSGGSLKAIVGYGYETRYNDYNQSLSTNEYFGRSVSLDNYNLVVGASQNDGYNDSSFNSGAVYTYNYMDQNFYGITPKGIIGNGYTNNNNKNVNAPINSNAYMGSGVSLNGTRLAVSKNDSGYGAVLLFSFADEDFNGGKYEGIIGNGYTGGKNINQPLNLNVYFGSSLSLDGTRLVVGSMNDNGYNDNKNSSGSVYLYTFSDEEFNNGTYVGNIGDGYTSDRSINQSLDANDLFGTSVSLQGDMLAIGAQGDAGYNNVGSSLGAVYLYSFTDNEFNGGQLEAIIGYGYTGDKYYNQSLDSGDAFGYSVSLNNNRIAIGATGDKGFENMSGTTSTGAVYLYSFSDSSFNNTTLQAIIGYGYTQGKDLNHNIDYSSSYGHSVGLENNRLAIGASSNKGYNKNKSSTGAVYIYSFTDEDFNNGNLDSTIGYGYTGNNDLNLNLDDYDNFGYSLSLNGSKLAVSSYTDDGYNNLQANSGAVYIFDLLCPLTPPLTFSNYSYSNVTISPDSLTLLLGSPQNVTLQANNDITISNDIIVNNASGDGGKLILQAGRSIFVNANVTTDNGDLDLIANELLANGVVDSERDDGNAVITMDTSTTIDAGTGTVTIDLREGTGKTYKDSGDITLNNITAGSILITNNGETNGSDVIINNSAALNASETGNSLVLSSANGTFTNNSDSNALVSGGRWLVYADNPTNITKGGLVGSKVYNTTYALNKPDTITQTGNRFLYSKSATLTFTADDKNKTYGDDNPSLTYVVSGYEDGDTSANAFSGDPSLSTTATKSSDVGVYEITTTLGTLVSDYGYLFNYVDDKLTINKKDLTVTADNKSKTYGSVNPTLTASYSGFVLGQDESVLGGSLTTDATQSSNVANYTITGSTLTSNNYNIISNNGTLTVNKANLTVTADDKAKTYGDLNPALTASYSGFVLGQDQGVLGGSLNLNTAAIQSSDAGDYGIAASGYTSGNYNILYTDGTLSIDKANLTVNVDDKSKTYGSVNPALTANYTGFVLGQDKGALGGSLNLDTAAIQSSDAGTYGITASGYTSGNYNISYTDGTLTINKANLTVTADDKAKTYGDLNPALTASYSGFVLGQDKGVLGGSLTTNAVQASDVGIYNITGSTLSSNNYNIISNDGELTINKADLTVNVDDKSKTYGSVNPALTANYTGFVLGQNQSVLGGSLTTTAIKNSPIGNYPITGRSLTSNNYNIISNDGILTVTATSDQSKNNKNNSQNPYNQEDQNNSNNSTNVQIESIYLVQEDTNTVTSNFIDNPNPSNPQITIIESQQFANQSFIKAFNRNINESIFNSKTDQYINLETSEPVRGIYQNINDLALIHIAELKQTLVLGEKSYIRIINNTIKKDSTIVQNPKLCETCLQKAIEKFNNLFVEKAGEGITTEEVIELTLNTINEVKGLK